jgi:hypothetical protein
MQAYEFGYLIGQLQKNAEDPGARSRAMINGMRQQGIASGQWANNGAGGFTQTNVTHNAAAKAKAQPGPLNPAAAGTPAAAAPKPAPAPPAAPAGNVTRMKSRTAF